MPPQHFQAESRPRKVETGISFRGTVLFAFGLTLLLSSISSAGPKSSPVQPPFAPRQESIFVGPGAVALAAVFTGDIQRDDQGLRWSSCSRDRGCYWLVNLPEKALDDGIIRSRFSFQRPSYLHTQVLARAHLTASAADGTGKEEMTISRAVGVQVAGRWAWLSQKSPSSAFEQIGLPVLLPHGRRRSYEIVMTLIGERMVVNIYDPRRNQHLCVLTSERIQFGSGRVGIRFAPQPRDPPRLSLFTARPACQQMPPAKLRGWPLAMGVPMASAPRVEEVISDGATELEHTADSSKGQSVIYRTDSAGFEHSSCSDIPISRLTGDLPWKWYDLTYLQHRGKPLSTTSGKVAIDCCYKDPYMVQAALLAWAERHPDITRLETIGHSRQGRPIQALAVGRDLSPNHRRPAFLIHGGIHGDEICSTEQVLDAAQQLLEHHRTDPLLQRALHELVIWIIPLLNPDGLASFMYDSGRGGRKNGADVDGDGKRGILDGVDLNRNFPFAWGRLSKSTPATARYYRGPKPSSEPETRALIALAERERFAASLSYHQGTIALLVPYSAKGAKQPEPNEAWQVAVDITQQFNATSPRTPFKVSHRLYDVDGVDQDWLRYAHGTVALLVEAARWPPPLDSKARQAVTRSTRPLWRALLQRFLDGPSLSGFVHDEDGRPVNATVSIREQQLSMEERWTTRPRDGRFDRFLPRPGTYHLVIEVPDAEKIIRAVAVEQEHRSIDIVIPTSDTGT